MNAEMRRNPAENRAVSYAVLASLLLHGMLLFAFTLRRSESPPAAPAPIVAHLVQPQTVAEPPPTPPSAEEPPKPRVEKPPPRVKPIPVPKRSALPAPTAPPPEPEAAATPRVAEPPIEPVEPVPSAPAQASPPAPVARIDPQPSPPPQSAPDTGTLDTYRLELMRMATKYKRYPRAAMDNNWEGRVVVRMVIGANGAIASISVRTSTGHELLDKQALDMIQKAKGGVLIPPALRGREFTLEIPVIYSLKDQDSG